MKLELRAGLLYVLLFTKEQSVIKVNVIVKNYMYRSHTGTCRAPVALSATLNSMKVLYTQQCPTQSECFWESGSVGVSEGRWFRVLYLGGGVDRAGRE